MKSLSNRSLVIVLLFFFLVLLTGSCNQTQKGDQIATKRPNILFAISDDQSFAHTSFAGSKFVNTPAFDRIASEGIYFTNCIAGSPGCAPSRSTIATGRYHWQNEQSGQHASSWMKKHVPFIDLLEANGYITGRTGKGVSPFQYARDANDSLWRATDAGGVEHSNISYKEGPNDERTAKGIGSTDYAENFKYFLQNVRKDKPFFFWYGAKEPHRSFEQDSWKRNNKKLEDVEVPGFFPDHDIVRGDMLDYAVEIEWFDLHLQRMLTYLEEIGELENTIVIVTADNGMAFPRAKANGYEYGVHVPMAIRFPKEYPGARRVQDPISFADIAPTILELTQTRTEGMLPISGKSILHILRSEKQGIVDEHKKYVFSGRERHSSSRYNNRGYPQRIIRSKDFLYIWNIKPERWPAGAPQRLVSDGMDDVHPMYGIDQAGIHQSQWAFTDIDAAPTKSFIVEHRNDQALTKEGVSMMDYFNWAHAKRPEYELFDISKDPFCLNNLAGNAQHALIEKEMKEALMQELTISEDPRVVGPDKEVFDSYLRYSPMRYFPQPEALE